MYYLTVCIVILPCQIGNNKNMKDKRAVKRACSHTCVRGAWRGAEAHEGKLVETWQGATVRRSPVAPRVQPKADRLTVSTQAMPTCAPKHCQRMRCEGHGKGLTLQPDTFLRRCGGEGAPRHLDMRSPHRPLPLTFPSPSPSGFRGGLTVNGTAPPFHRRVRDRVRVGGKAQAPAAHSSSSPTCGSAAGS